MNALRYYAARFVARRQAVARRRRTAEWERLAASAPTQPVITALGDKLRVRIYPHDVIGRHIFVDGWFERAECRFVSRFLRPGMAFVDAGANLGQYTLLAAQRVGRLGRVHAFEPSPRMFGELRYNVALNRFEARCTLNQAALFDKRGTHELTRCPPGCEVYASLGTPARPDVPFLGRESVATTTLDDYVAEHGIAHIDLIKLDIEGAELFALRGAQALLTRAHAPALVLELADINTTGLGYRALETWDFLLQLGYRLHSFDDAGRIAGAAPRPADFERAQNLVALKTR